MMTRRDLMGASLALGAATALGAAARASTPELNWTHFPAGANGFFRAPVLVSGPTEAVLIDAGFTYGDGRALADAIRASGRKLTTIYVSQSDPDYYFSLKPIQQTFPEAQVLAASETIAAIQANVVKKLETWGPQLQDNGPQTLDDIVMPQPFDGPALLVDGRPLEIVAATGLPNRRYIWSPDLQAVLGGVMIFSGVHVWTADTPSAESRAAWIDNLDRIAARQPQVVIPGHMTRDAATGLAAIDHTRNYLRAFEEELARASDAAALRAAMLARYPQLEMGVALDIGSKVATGEMRWG